VPELNQRPSD